MPGRIVTLNASATAGADGTATVRFAGPGDAWNVYDVDVISCTSTSSTRPTVTLYRGEPAGGIVIAVNPDGIAGAFDGGGRTDVLGASDVWALRWEGADPGAVCTAALSAVERRR